MSVDSADVKGILTAQAKPASGTFVAATVGGVPGSRIGGIASVATVDIVQGPLGHVEVTPSTVKIGSTQKQKFAAKGSDQYDNEIPGLTFMWSVVNGGGTIDAAGTFEAGLSDGDYANTIKAEAAKDGVTQAGYASVTVTKWLDVEVAIKEEAARGGYLYTLGIKNVGSEFCNLFQVNYRGSAPIDHSEPSDWTYKAEAGKVMWSGGRLHSNNTISFHFTIPEQIMEADWEAKNTDTGNFDRGFFSTPPSPTATLVLKQGLNMISLPLQPDTPYNARTFAQKLRARFVIEYNWEENSFVVFLPEVATTDGFLIRGGQGYIVNVMEEIAVEFTGRAWEGTLQAPPQPSPTQGETWAFVVAGRVEADIAQVEVLNPRTGMKAVGTCDEGVFTVALVDLNRRDVVSVGDKLQIQLHSRLHNPGDIAKTHVVRVRDIEMGYTLIDVKRALPRQTTLGQNFPNPFNPETWIPYELAENADVTIRIYDVQGRLIRELAVGYQAAGVYMDKSRAGHWDGTNAQGERVGNGIYFYQLEAGTRSITRRMTVVK